MSEPIVVSKTNYAKAKYNGAELPVEDKFAVGDRVRVAGYDCKANFLGGPGFDGNEYTISDISRYIERRKDGSCHTVYATDEGYMFADDELEAV